MHLVQQRARLLLRQVLKASLENPASVRVCAELKDWEGQIDKMSASSGVERDATWETDLVP